jgi:hypothetical protein
MRGRVQRNLTLCSVVQTGSEPELDHLKPVCWGSVLNLDSTSELNLGQVPGSENSWKNRTELDFGSTSTH